MRKILVIEKQDEKSLELAEKFDIGELASNVPRFAGVVTFYPAIVVESASIPGQILGVFNPDKFSADDLDALEDLPAPVVETVPVDTTITDLQAQINDLKNIQTEMKGNIETLAKH